jgi:hypothetical protein
MQFLFLALVQGVELHPGLVVIVDGERRAAQVHAFEIALTIAEAQTSMINKVVEVSAAGSVDVYDLAG